MSDYQIRETTSRVSIPEPTSYLCVVAGYIHRCGSSVWQTGNKNMKGGQKSDFRWVSANLPTFGVSRVVRAWYDAGTEGLYPVGPQGTRLFGNLMLIYFVPYNTRLHEGISESVPDDTRPRFGRHLCLTEMHATINLPNELAKSNSTSAPASQSMLPPALERERTSFNFPFS